ncbi:MAG: hypothetical protein WCF25_09025 [Acidimicrobiales bacterium]
MRKSVLILGVVVASLGLSACGSGAKATIDSSVASLGAQPDLQVHFTASATGAGTAEAQKVLDVISMDANYASANGDPLSQSKGATDGEVTFNVGDKVLLDLRAIDSNLYVQIDLTAVNAIPGLPLTSQDQSELAALQLLLGGKWFEIPSSLIAKELPSSDALKAKTAQDEALDRKLFDALSNLIDNGDATALSSGGYSETGTLESVVKAVLPTIESVDPSAGSSINTVPGNYTLTLNDNGTVATGGSISITAPEGSDGSGDTTVSLSATVTHNTDAITAPTGATVITPALIQQLLGSTSSL